MIGVLGVGYDRTITEPFGQEAIHLLTQFARFAALCIENARLLSIADAELTEHIQAEEALRASEIRFRTLIEQSPVAILVSRYGNCLYGNQKLLSMFGFKRAEETVNRPIMEFTSPQHREEDLDHIRQRILGPEGSGEYETVGIRQDGTQFPVHIAVGQVQLADGPAYISYVRDITDSKWIEGALLQSEARLAQAVRIAGLGIWDWDLATDRVAWYGDMFRFYGIKPDTFTGKGQDYINFTRADYQETQKQIIQAAFENGITEADLLAHRGIKSDPKELCIVRPDGSECYTLGDAVSIVDEHRNPIPMLGVTFDITERKRMEEALRRSEAELKRSQAVAHIGHWVWDTQANQVTGSDELYRIFGSNRGAFTGDLNAAINAAIHPDDKERVVASSSAVLTRQKSETLEYRVIWPDGSIHHIWAQPADAIFDDTGKIVLLSGVVQDITERKRVLSLMQARLRSLDEFARSHSLQELLGATLDEIEALTESKIGFYHFLESDQTLWLQTWSTNTRNHMDSAQKQGRHYPVDEAGRWVDCIAERRPVIHNDYASLAHRNDLPENHAPVIGEAVVPIFRDGLIKAVIGVGNKSAPYNESDIEIISQLGDFSWEIAERKRAEDALRESERRYRSLYYDE